MGRDTAWSVGMLAGARCDGLSAHRHGRVELVVHGLDSHHWLLDTEPPHGVRVGGWHLLVRYQLEAFQVPSSKHAQRKQSSSQPTALLTVLRMFGTASVEKQQQKRK